MATATSMPEFFTNTISTLILDSDMGLGTIIGSLMFNTLGVAGLAALAIDKVRYMPFSLVRIIISLKIAINSDR